MRNPGVAILVLLLAACEPTPTAPPASPSPAPPSAAATEAVIDVCGTVITNAAPSGSATRAIAVFPSADGLSLYDIGADAVTVIDPTPSDWGPAPQFRTPTLVSFVRKREPPDDTHTFGQDSLYELDLERGGPREMLRLPNYLLAFAWSPDRAVLAYLVEPEGDTALCLFDSQSGLIRRIRTLSYTGGRGVAQWDERSIAWSPDAANLLVLDTLQSPSIYVVDTDGKDIFGPQTGTFARWLSYGVVLFAKGSPSGGTAEKFTWATIPTATGVPVSFGLPDAAFRPSLSPAGGRIAFDDGAKVPTVFVFDIDTGTARSLARGYVGPVWLGRDLIGATAAEPAPPNEFGDIPWATLGSTIGIDPKTGEHRSLTLPATLESTLQGEIDVFVPATQAATELLATLPEVAGGEMFDHVQVVYPSFLSGHAVDDVLSELQKERSDAVSVFRGGEGGLIGAITVEGIDGGTLLEAFVVAWHAPAVIERRQRFAAGIPAWELRHRGGRLTVVYPLGDVIYLVESDDRALLEAILLDMPTG